MRHPSTLLSLVKVAAYLLCLCRFGIDALRGALSSQLVKLAETELPKVKHAIEAALAEVSSDDAYMRVYDRLAPTREHM